MKNILITFLVLVFTFSLAFSQEKPDKMKIDQIVRGFKSALNAENAGVRYSACHVIAKFKSDHPERDLDELKDVLFLKSTSDNNDLVRIHAKFTYLYLVSKDLARKIKVTNPEDPMVFYSALHRELHNRQFGLQDLTKEEVLNQLQRLINELK